MGPILPEPAMILIIDYGMGNLRSVQKGFERHGHAAEISSDPDRLAKAEKIVLPGVGAFGDGMRELRERNLIEPISDAIDSGKPFLGICLGLQLLFTTGFEDGEQPGLGILEGRVVRFPRRPGLKVPHMGWNQLHLLHPSPLLEGTQEASYVYFVHSYYAVPEDPEIVAAESDYDGPFAACLWRDNVFATQFHPEKSQHVGLRMLRNFAELC